MPVVPSFSGYAQTPNVAEAYLGGGRNRLAQEQLKQQAIEAANRISLGYAQIAAQQQEAQLRYQQEQMEWAARQQIASQQLLQEQQKAEIDQAYRQATIGISRANLERQQMETMLNLNKAIREEDWMAEKRAILETPGVDAGGAATYFAAIEGRNPPGAGARAPYTQTTVEDVTGPGGEVIGERLELEGGRTPQFVRERANPNIRRWQDEVKELRTDNRTIEMTYDPERFRDLLNPQTRAYKKSGPAVREQIQKWRTNNVRIDELQKQIREAEAPRRAFIPAPTMGGTNAPAGGRFRVIERQR